MPTTAGIGYGCVISHGTVPTVLKECYLIETEGTVDEVDASSFDSASATKEFIPGLVDSGEVNVQLMFRPGQTDYDGLGTAFRARTVQAWTIDHPLTTNKATFQGWIKSLGAAIPHDDKMTARFSVKITGPVTITAG